MKVRIFSIGENLIHAEELIDIWLEENPDIEIIHVLQSADSSTDDNTGIISIWYN